MGPSSPPCSEKAAPGCPELSAAASSDRSLPLGCKARSGEVGECGAAGVALWRLPGRRAGVDFLPLAPARICAQVRISFFTLPPSWINEDAPCVQNIFSQQI